MIVFLNEMSNIISIIASVFIDYATSPVWYGVVHNLLDFENKLSE